MGAGAGTPNGKYKVSDLVLKVSDAFGSPKSPLDQQLNEKKEQYNSGNGKVNGVLKLNSSSNLAPTRGPPKTPMSARDQEAAMGGVSVSNKKAHFNEFASYDDDDDIEGDDNLGVVPFVLSSSSGSDDDDEESSSSDSSFDSSASSSSDEDNRRSRKKKKKAKEKAKKRRKLKLAAKEAAKKRKLSKTNTGLLASTSTSTLLTSEPSTVPMVIDSEDTQLLELLREFIAFYNQGDDYNNMIVRDTIAKLSPDVLDHPDAYGNTILLITSQYGHADLVPLLMSKGVNVNARNRDGASSLHFACYTDSFSPQTVQLLIQSGSRPEVVERTYGCTPLHWAASAADTSLCKYLCDAGALPSTLDNHGCDPIAYAQQHPDGGECVSFLNSFKKLLEGGRGNLAYTAPTPPKGKYIGSSGREASSYNLFNNSTNNGNSAINWKGEKDEVSGCTYYINFVTGESLWEDEYFAFKRAQFASNGDGNGIVQSGSMIGGGPPTSIPPSNNKLAKALSVKVDSKEDEEENKQIKDNFEQRLIDMQQKMEAQLISQLKSLESKIQAPGGITESVAGVPAGYVDSTTVELLRGDIGKKELELLKVNKQVIDLQEQLNVAQSSVDSASKKDKNAVPDEGLWVAAERLDKAEKELKLKIDKLEALNLDTAQLQAAIGAAERLLAVTEKKLQSEAEKSASLESQVIREREGKDEAIKLLESATSSASAGNDESRLIVAGLDNARKQSMERVGQMEHEIVALRRKAEDEVAKLNIGLEEKANVLTEFQRKIKDMEDKAALDLAKNEEGAEERRVEHIKQLNEVRKELQEQQLLRLSQFTELNEAKQAASIARDKEAAARKELNENQEKVQEALQLKENNDRLYKALGIETERRKVLHNKLEDLKGRIRVYVRVRPLSNSEIKKNCLDICKNEGKRTVVILPDEANEKDAAKTWEFDSVFAGSEGNGNTQGNVFKDTSHLMTSAVDGFNVCIFAYGQTGSGKTYTMFGNGGVGDGIHEDGTIDPQTGLAPRAAAELFRVLKEKETSSIVSVSATMFELYNDALVDLLSPVKKSEREKLEIKLAEHSSTGMVEVKGSCEETVDKVEDLLKLFQRGAKSRTVAMTQMNADSSRSHLITSIVTKVINKRTGAAVCGKLTLVDLAGSERVGKSGATGEQLKEAQSINKSLSALGDVISALTGGSKHIPYRNHPLTMLMSDSIGGNAKTLMFVCCSPADYNRSESGTSLDFAKRCKDVKLGAGGSEQQAAQLKALRQELNRMKGGGGGGARAPGGMKRPGEK